MDGDGAIQYVEVVVKIDALLPESVVRKYVPYGRTQLWEMVRSGEFPPPRRVGPNRRAWLASEVQDWIKSRPVSLHGKPRIGEQKKLEVAQ